MSPRKRKSPVSVAIETILWHDADMQMREKLDTNPTIQRTVGFVVHEDSKQIVLAHEVSAVEDWLDEVMDYTKIPLALVVSRTKLGDIVIAREETDVADVPDKPTEV